MPITLEWGDHVVPITSVEELDALVDQLTAQAEATRPFIVTLGQEDDSSLSIGLGRPLSVASSISAGLGPPHYLSRGDEANDEPIEFVFSGEASEYPPESVISVEAARRALRTFFETGDLTGEIAWEEI